MDKEMKGLNGVYKTIAQLIGLEECLVLYKHLKGLSITFPTKLIDPEYVKKQIRKKLQEEGMLTREEIQQLAIYYDYSERQIRRFLQEISHDEQNIIEEGQLSYISSWLKQQKEKDDKNE